MHQFLLPSFSLYTVVYQKAEPTNPERETSPNISRLPVSIEKVKSPCPKTAITMGRNLNTFLELQGYRVEAAKTVAAPCKGSAVRDRITIISGEEIPYATVSKDEKKRANNKAPDKKEEQVFCLNNFTNKIHIKNNFAISSMSAACINAEKTRCARIDWVRLKEERKVCSKEAQNTATSEQKKQTMT